MWSGSVEIYKEEEVECRIKATLLTVGAGTVDSARV